LYDHTVLDLPTPIPNGTWFKTKVVSIEDLDGITIDEAVKRLPNSNKLILKSDIEDSEWEIFSQCSTENLLKFDQIIVEFHWLTEKILNEKHDLMISAENLARTHSVINIHANNYANYEIVANCPIPEVIELTYVRTNSYDFEKILNDKKLNAPNFDKKPEISLSFPMVV
jgi:TRAP-type mannitol/chloroaromatic compound transport system substrate-binding protein